MISAFNRIDVSENCKELLHDYFGIENYYSLNFAKFVKLFSNEYREGLLIVLNMEVFEIVHILRNGNEEEVSFLCQSFCVKRYDSFYNSIEIAKTTANLENLRIISFS